MVEAAFAVVNLKPFFDRGGKLLMYHGWADQNVSPHNTVQYFRSVQEVLGPEKTGNRIGRITPQATITEFFVSTIATSYPYGITPGPDGAQKRRPGTNVPLVGQSLRAVRIVQGKHGGLRKHVRGAQAGRVIRVPFDLRRTTSMTLNQYASRNSVQ
jgi:hypothetical protein